MSEVLSMGFDTCMSTLAPSIYNPVNVLLQTNPDTDTKNMTKCSFSTLMFSIGIWYTHCCMHNPPDTGQGCLVARDQE